MWYRQQEIKYKAASNLRYRSHQRTWVDSCHQVGRGERCQQNPLRWLFTANSGSCKSGDTLPWTTASFSLITRDKPNESPRDHNFGRGHDIKRGRILPSGR